MVRQATETAVSASISTPVGPMHRVSARPGKAGESLIRRNVDRNRTQAYGMAERNEIGGLLGGHDAGDPRRADDVALLGVPGKDRSQRRRSHPHPSFGDRDPVRGRLVRYV